MTGRGPSPAGVHAIAMRTKIDGIRSPTDKTGFPVAVRREAGQPDDRAWVSEAVGEEQMELPGLGTGAPGTHHHVGQSIIVQVADASARCARAVLETHVWKNDCCRSTVPLTGPVMT